MNRTLTAVRGIHVGHHQRIGRGWLTGTTVVVAPGGATAGVDVRGGAPGTRETDALAPMNLVQRVHAVCLTGGSAYGLAAADGVMAWCERAGLGFPVGRAAHERVPVVPAAVLFDLGRGGSFSNRPDAGFGHRAAAAASARPPRAGTVGAGSGAVAGGLKGGVGHAATTVLDGTITVAALAVVNSAGSVIDPDSALPWERHPSWPLRRPDAADRRRLREHLAALTAARQAEPMNTTIGVVAVDTHLTKAECTKLAEAAQVGLGRAARPSQLMVDGDAVFALATGDEPLVVEATDPAFLAADTRPALLNVLMAAAADCFAAACVDAVAAATAAAGIPAYRDLCPSAFARLSA